MKVGQPEQIVSFLIRCFGYCNVAKKTFRPVCVVLKRYMLKQRNILELRTFST